MARNMKLEKIDVAQKEVTRLVADESRMRKRFSADGIDREEQTQLDAINKDIDKLRNLIAALRKEVETNKRNWEARGREFETAKEQIRKLSAWPDPQAPKLESKLATIGQAVTDERWLDASEALTELVAEILPIFTEYELQVAARGRCAPLNDNARTRILQARDSCLANPAIMDEIRSVEANLSAAVGLSDALDYVAAEPLFIEIHTHLDSIDRAIIQLLADRDAYEAAWRNVEPRLAEISFCEFPDLAPMQEDIIGIADHVRALADTQDFAEATALIPDLSTKIQTYMDAYASRVDAQTLYNSRLAAIRTEVTGALVSEFPALSPLQAEISSTFDEMEGLASTGAYEEALLKMDALVPLLDSYREALEQALLGQAFELRMRELAPRIGATAVSSYGPLDPLSSEIDTLRAEAEGLYSSADYAAGIAKLDTCELKLDAYDALLAKIEAAKTTYDGKLPAILGECEAINQCVYAELSEVQATVLTLRDHMEQAAQTGDYPAALEKMKELESALAVVRTERAALDAARTEYELRLPSILNRHEGMMKESDFAELEEPRKNLEKVRASMESFATQTLFREAVLEMNEFERQMDDIDARQGTLINRQAAYMALYKLLKPQLAKVEACTHVELESKRTPILADRDKMLAFAEKTEFDEALPICAGLIAPVARFLYLEERLKKYHSLLVPMTKRIETIRTFTYKSLKDDIEEVEKLFSAMQKNAAEAKIDEAITQMGELEGKVSALIKLNDDLKESELLYNKLASDMKEQIDAIEDNDSENEKIKDARKAVLDAHKEMKEQAEKHEFIKAVDQANKINKPLIPNYLEAVNKHATEEEKYKLVRDFATSSYNSAKKDAKDYEDHLESDFSDIDKLFDEMNDAGDDKKFTEGIAKGNALIKKVEAMKAELAEVKQREAALKASADKAKDEFKALPDEAEDKAKDEYDKAEKLVSSFDSLLKDKEFDALEESLEEFDGLMDKIDDALKTQGEHESEYEGLLRTLGKRVKDAENSDFKDFLTDEIGKVTSAFEAMKKRADQDDFEGAVDKAPDVEKELTAFDAAEDKFEQAKARYDERISLIEPQYKRLKTLAGELADPGVNSLVKGFQKNWDKAKSAEGSMDYVKALDLSKDFGKDIIAMLDLCETVRKKREEAEKDDGGILDDIEDIADDVTDAVKDFVKDKVYEKAKKYVGKKWVNAVDTGWDIVAELYDGDVVGAAKELAEGVWEASPYSDLAELADEALDSLFDEAAEQIRKRL